MTKQCVLLTIRNLVWLCALHTVVHMTARWMPKASMCWYAKKATGRNVRHQVLNSIIYAVGPTRENARRPYVVNL